MDSEKIAEMVGDLHDELIKDLDVEEAIDATEASVFQLQSTLEALREDLASR
jgi:phage regulator Rha-like protein